MFKSVCFGTFLLLNLPLWACSPTGQGNAVSPSPSPSSSASAQVSPPVSASPTAATPVSPAPTSSPSTEPVKSPLPEIHEVELGKAFDLPLGQSAQLKNSPLTLSWKTPAQDSRCPSDVNCIWAGEVKVAVLTQKGQSSATLNLGLPGNASGALAAEMGNYTLTLNDVKPYPQTQKPATEKQSLNLTLTQP